MPGVFCCSANCQLLIANSRGFYAETKDTQRRCQALQVDGDRKSEAGTRETASHPDVQGTQNETEARQVGPGERWRSRQGAAHDSVPMRKSVARAPSPAYRTESSLCPDAAEGGRATLSKACEEVRDRRHGESSLPPAA